MKTVIYCLFSVENAYDQPEHNLVCWWGGKPKLEDVAKAVGQDFPSYSDEITVAIVKLWSDPKYSAVINETTYSLCVVEEGKIL